MTSLSTPRLSVRSPRFGLLERRSPATPIRFQPSARTMKRTIILLTLLLLAKVHPSAPAQQKPSPDLTTFQRRDADFRSAKVTPGLALLESEKWAFLQTKQEYEHLDLAATFTIQEPARQFQFFGESWSVWPDRTF